MNELPILESERKEFRYKIKQLQGDLELAQTSTLHRVNRIVNEAKYLTEEQKTLLLEAIWK